MIAYAAARLREPSTWAGLGAFIVAAANAYASRDPATIGAAVASLVAIVKPDTGR